MIALSTYTSLYSTVWTPLSLRAPWSLSSLCVRSNWWDISRLFATCAFQIKVYFATFSSVVFVLTWDVKKKNNSGHFCSFIAHNGQTEQKNCLLTDHALYQLCSQLKYCFILISFNYTHNILLSVYFELNHIRISNIQNRWSGTVWYM